MTLNPDVMGGKPCIKGLRITVGTVIGLLASGLTNAEILKMYPYLQQEDLMQALIYSSPQLAGIKTFISFSSCSPASLQYLSLHNLQLTGRLHP
jgi:uncharacterized protein (DUF433 family)